jgi:hypothetical protein
MLPCAAATYILQPAPHLSASARPAVAGVDRSDDYDIRRHALRAVLRSCRDSDAPVEPHPRSAPTRSPGGFFCTVVRKNSIRRGEGGSRREYGMIGEC